MTTDYEKIRVTKRVGHGVLVEVETSMDYIRCTLTANEARLLAQDLLKATLGAGGAPAPAAEPSEPAPKTEIVDAHTLRRDIQQIARNQQDMAQAIRALTGRIEAIESLARVAKVTVAPDISKITLSAFESGARTAEMGAAYDTGSPR